LTLHSKFCKEKRWKCWKMHRFFSWSNSYGRPAQVKNMKVFSILILWNTWKWFQINVMKYMKVISTLVFFFFVKYMKVISTLVLWNTWKWFQHLFYETHESDFRLAFWNTWKWFQHWFFFFLWNTWKWFQP